MFCPTIYKHTLQIIFILYIGDTHLDHGKYNEARDYFTQALEMYQRLYKGDHYNIADTLYWIGKMNYYLKSVSVL